MLFDPLLGLLVVLAFDPEVLLLVEFVLVIWMKPVKNYLLWQKFHLTEKLNFRWHIVDWGPNHLNLPSCLQITSHSPNFPDPLIYSFFLSTSVAHQNITPLLLGSVQPWSVHFLYSIPLYLKGKTHFLSGSLFVYLFQFFLVLHSKQMIKMNGWNHLNEN